MKFCEGCFWFRALGSKFEFPDGYCLTDYEFEGTCYHLNAVAPSLVVSHHRHGRDASAMRADYDACGPQARWFRPKRSWFSRCILRRFACISKKTN